MPHLIAAVDDSLATAPVIAVAQWYAALADLEVVALHVSEDGSGRTARAVAEQAGVRFEIRTGDPLHELLQAAEADGVRALVLGARGIPTKRMPAGHVALDVIRRVTKPVIVVPPDARLPHDRHLRLLAPIDHNPSSADALCALLDEADFPNLELVLLHVFDANHVPMFSNHPAYEPATWAEEFARRAVPREAERARVETRVGHPAATILDAERELGADLVVLAWGRKLLGGRASVVRRLLSHATTPLVLIPVTHHTSRATRVSSGSPAGSS